MRILFSTHLKCQTVLLCSFKFSEAQHLCQKLKTAVLFVLFYKVNTVCLLSSCRNVLNKKKENFRDHLPLQGSVSGLVCLLPLSCLPLSIPWPLPPAFEARRPSLLLPDRIPHILRETGRSPAPSPSRHTICAPAASSKPFTLLTDLQQQKWVLKCKIETTVNSVLCSLLFLKLKQNYFIPRNKKNRLKSVLGGAPQICEDHNSWHQFAWASFGRARPCFSEHGPDLHLMQT